MDSNGHLLKIGIATAVLAWVCTSCTSEPSEADESAIALQTQDQSTGTADNSLCGSYAPRYVPSPTGPRVVGLQRASGPNGQIWHALEREPTHDEYRAFVVGAVASLGSPRDPPSVLLQTLQVTEQLRNGLWNDGHSRNVQYYRNQIDYILADMDQFAAAAPSDGALATCQELRFGRIHVRLLLSKTDATLADRFRSYAEGLAQNLAYAIGEAHLFIVRLQHHEATYNLGHVPMANFTYSPNDSRSPHDETAASNCATDSVPVVTIELIDGTEETVNIRFGY